MNKNYLEKDLFNKFLKKKNKMLKNKNNNV